MRIKTIFSLGFLALFTTTSWAQEEKEGRGNRPREQRRSPEGRPEGGPGDNFPGMRLGQALGPQAHPLYIALDTDKDGKLSASELENATKSLLKLDKNGDGAVSLEELRPDPSQMREGMPRPGENGPPSGEMLAMMFERSDANKDGKLTGDEIPERMRERLNMIDTNGDGSIDKEEMKRMASRLGDRPGPRGERSDKDGSGVRPKRPGDGQ